MGKSAMWVYWIVTSILVIIAILMGEEEPGEFSDPHWWMSMLVAIMLWPIALPYVIWYERRDRAILSKSFE